MWFIADTGVRLEYRDESKQIKLALSVPTLEDAQHLKTLLNILKVKPIDVQLFL